MFNTDMFKALHPLSYYLKADEFWLMACHLEKISAESAVSFQEQSRKLNSTPGFIKVEGDAGHDLQIAVKTMKAGSNVSLYLRAVSVELLLKGLYWECLKKTPPTIHHVSRIYKDIEEFVRANKLNEIDVENLLGKLDEILIWAGRYPEPKKNQFYENSKKKLAKTAEGYYTEDLILAVDLQLLKEFYVHVFNYASSRLQINLL